MEVNIWHSRFFVVSFPSVRCWWLQSVYTITSRTRSSHIFFLGSSGNCEWAKSWVNVYFDMNTTCQRLWDQLAHGKLAKSLHIWANLKRGGQAFLGSWVHVHLNDWLVCTKSSSCKSFSLNVNGTRLLTYRGYLPILSDPSRCVLPNKYVKLDDCSNND